MVALTAVEHRDLATRADTNYGGRRSKEGLDTVHVWFSCTVGGARLAAPQHAVEGVIRHVSEVGIRAYGFRNAAIRRPAGDADTLKWIR